ncbi:MAG: PucR family transcriptional regulator [Anaerolineales bacterium]
MLTLRQALKLPCFRQATVVAGEKGLDRIIHRVHVVDIPDATYAWGSGALLLTAGYGLKDSAKRQAALIPTLVKQELVGMVFSVGWYFDEAPDAIRRAADEHHFPLIVVPPEVQFINITERLYTEIVSEQFALKERADDIHNRLTRLVLEGGDLTAVAQTLTHILERSVLIDSVGFEVLAHAEHGPMDESRQRVLRLGRTPPEIVQRIMRRGVYAEVQQKLRHVRIPAMPDLGMTMERVVSPIVVGGDIYGYIWIVAGDRPLTDLDELAIDHAATVAALVLLKEQAVREAELAVRGDLLAQLLRLDSKLDGSTLERAHLAGYRTDQSHQALFVISGPAAAGAIAQLATQIERKLRHWGEWGLVVTRERGLAVIIESRANPTGNGLACRLVAELNNAAQPLMIGIGQVYPTEKSLRRTYDEALEAAEIGQRLGGSITSASSRVVNFWELGLLDWLYRLPTDALEGNPYLRKVEILSEHDARTRGELTLTLETYLEYGGALAEAATALNVHRNTLLYRLGRIEEIIDVDLRDTRQRINLYVALKGYRLRE